LNFEFFEFTIIIGDDFVSGTGAEGAEKRLDVDGVEGWGMPGCPLARRLGYLGSVVSSKVGIIFVFGILSSNGLI